MAVYLNRLAKLACFILLPLGIGTILRQIILQQDSSILSIFTSSESYTENMTGNRLYNVIETGDFWTQPDDEVLTIIRDTFPNEMNRLKNAYSLIPNLGADDQPKTPSISERLYGKKFDEINRTLTGILALRWLWNNEYDIFVGNQQSARLKPASFEWLRDLFKTEMTKPEDIFTLVVSMITNDLGKDHNLAIDYRNLKGIDISKTNHDMILLHAVNADMVPALRLLSPQYLEYVKAGIELGAQFNFGQLAQAESAPASLASLREMEGQAKAFQIRFLEQVLDLAGASGHEDWTSARKMTEPVFQSYKNVYDAANGIISGPYNLREGYDLVLIRKKLLLKDTGYAKDFGVNISSDRAMLRLFCMGNVNNGQMADTYDTAFNQRLSNETREKLIIALNLDGSVEEPTVQPTYAPAMLTKACNNVQPGVSTPVDAVTAILEYLVRVMTLSTEDRKKLPEGVTVVERDIRCIESIVSGPDFRHSPRETLETVDLPEAQVANTL